MKVDNNLNSMIQLNNKLEKSANELAKLNSGNQQPLKQEQHDTKKADSQKKEQQDNQDVAKELIKQIEIPIAYTANAEVISTQDAATKTILDITA